MSAWRVMWCCGRVRCKAGKKNAEQHKQNLGNGGERGERGGGTDDHHLRYTIERATHHLPICCSSACLCDLRVSMSARIAAMCVVNVFV